LQFVTTVLHEPELIILDEPFSGLDPVNANLIKDEIFNLAKNGSTVIFSTHRMEQVEEICDHIVLVNKGKKILDGSVIEIKNQFKQHVYRLGASTNAHDLMTYIFEVIKHQPNELLLKLQHDSTTNDVLKFFISQNIPIHSFNEVLPTLNEIFIQLVEGTPEARQFEKIN
jgi:ABC-2 type transport system ATP-binding protein